MVFRCLAALPAAVCACGLAAQDAPHAFVGARIVPIDAAVIDRGTLLVRAGRIVAVGPTAEVRVPDDAVTVDAAGRTIMPGLVCSHSHIGSVAGADASGPIQPEVRALDSINPLDPGIQKAQAGGITTV
ncbi:MAG TPA: amidohydrolase, partial [Planctomycetota bacterium]|nr:amidohydrolase [Planctomycetota bacterium]